MQRSAWQTALIGFLALMLGCGSGGPKTYTITGTVTFDGTRVENGEIIFVPLERDDAPDSGFIKNGTYKVQVKAGDKRVEIRASREVPETPNPMGPVYQPYIPDRYNEKSILTAAISADGKKQWDFALESQRE
jgi:hypothetical protein